MHIGLYFGSFNPVHTGHLIIANYVSNNVDVDQVWLIVSPQNPLKPSKSLLNEYHRLHLVQLATEDDPKIKASDVEFKLPKPSYTITTLSFLQEKYPSYKFSVVMGADSFQNIHNWKNSDILLRDHHFLIYNRHGFEIPVKRHNINTLDAPLLGISATEIRQLIKQKKSIRYMVPEKVRLEIEANNYYGL